MNSGGSVLTSNNLLRVLNLLHNLIVKATLMLTFQGLEGSEIISGERLCSTLYYVIQSMPNVNGDFG